MDPLVPHINFKVVGLAATLGKSPEDTTKDCSIRELLLYLAMLPDPQEYLNGQPSPATSEHAESPSI